MPDDIADLLSNPIVRFYRTPCLEKAYFAGDWETVEKECLAIEHFALLGIVNAWFDDHGDSPPWLTN